MSLSQASTTHVANAVFLCNRAHAKGANAYVEGISRASFYSCYFDDCASGNNGNVMYIASSATVCTYDMSTLDGVQGTFTTCSEAPPSLPPPPLPPQPPSGARIELTGDQPRLAFGDPGSPTCELYLNREGEGKLVSSCPIADASGRRLGDAGSSLESELNKLRIQLAELRSLVANYTKEKHTE